MVAAIKQETGAETPGQSQEESPVRVLLIDDDPAYRHLCQRYLDKNTSTTYDLVSVPTAEAGIDECESHTFDCLLIDYSLPDATGTQVFRSLSDVLNDFTPPAIILTADGGEAAATDAVRAGATDFMSKQSVSSESLSRAINNAVEKSHLRKSVIGRNRELQLAYEALRSRNSEINRFYHSVSHEVKTPLAAAREFIAIVLDGIAGPVTEMQTEMLTHAIDSCDQITEHFNALVEMTRLDAKKVAINKKLGSLENVVTRSLAGIASTVRAKSITLVEDIESPLPLVKIDGNRVTQVLSNLLGNAVKFTEPGGTIQLRVTHDVFDGMIQISVVDSGCGIDEADLPHVFDRLYQVRNEGDELMGAGLGLGLSIAKEIVSLHDGEILAESTPGEGSTFSVRLPTAHSIFTD